jgi:hypothetical protein
MIARFAASSTMDQSRAAPLRAFDKERTGTRGPIVGEKPLGVERSRSDGTISGSPPAWGKQALSVLFALALIGLHCRASAASVETIDGLAAAQIVSNAPFDNQLKAISAIGLHRARLGLRWSETEKVRGRFDWSLADRKMADMRRQGVTPIVILFGGNKAYRTAATDGSGPPADGEALAGFARFAAAAAARYKSTNPDMPILFEIWNEPNTKTFWGRAPDPEAYAGMAAAACSAIKASNPQARVLALAMEGTPVKARYFVLSYMIDIYRQWAASAATPQLMQCADGFSMHPYLPTPEQVLAAEPELRAFVAAHWAKRTSPLIVFSEWGYGIDMKRGGTAADQAALDLRALLIGTGLKRVTNLFQSVDTGRDPAKPDQRLGLVAADGRFKPAGDAVRRLIQAIGGHVIERVDMLTNPNGGEPVYRFTAHRGSARALVLWTAGKPAIARVPAAASAMDLVTGAAKPVASGAVTVGPAPTLISWTAQP